jgi:Fic family protein
MPASRRAFLKTCQKPSKSARGSFLADPDRRVIKSSEIEGEILNRDQVRSSIARRLGLDIGALAPADRHVEGVVEMMLDATERYSEAVTAERLFGWHAALFPTGRCGPRPEHQLFACRR